MEPSARLLSYTMPASEPALGKWHESAVPGLDEPLDLIEYAGRWDYGPRSVSKMGDRDIIRRWIGSGEESMVEMVDATFLITCSRVVTHELVRHRLASFQQESQRYVKYDEESQEDLFYVPEGLEENEAYEEAMYHALKAYKALKRAGVKSQIARYVLPNATRARIVVKANLREWRHILKLRMHKSAQPEMQTVARLIFDQLNALFPEVFSDIPAELEAGERAAR